VEIGEVLTKTILTVLWDTV